MGCSESAPDANGHITLDAKQAGKRSAGNPHAAFDEAGAGNVTSGAGFTGPYRRRASPRPYLIDTTTVRGGRRVTGELPDRNESERTGGLER